VSWFREHVGLDGFDLLIHAGVTSAFIGFVAMSNGPEEHNPVATGVSLLVLALRRHVALRTRRQVGLSSGEMAAERLAGLEQRMEELEAEQARVTELEERLDFAERLLATRDAQLALPPAGQRPGTGEVDFSGPRNEGERC